MKRLNLPLFAIIIFGILMLLSGMSSGVKNGIKLAQSEAILHHTAHYEVDTKGNPVFTWNTPIAQPPTP